MGVSSYFKHLKLLLQNILTALIPIAGILTLLMKPSWKQLLLGFGLKAASKAQRSYNYTFELVDDGRPTLDRRVLDRRILDRRVLNRRVLDRRFKMVH